MLDRPLAAILANPPTCYLRRMRYPVKGTCSHSARYPKGYKCVPPHEPKTSMHRMPGETFQMCKASPFRQRCKIQLNQVGLIITAKQRAAIAPPGSIRNWALQDWRSHV